MPTEPVTGRNFILGLASILAIGAILHFGREILLPLSIAILLTFVLSPVCTWLERRGVWRIAAVLLTLGSVTSVFAIIALIVGMQLSDLAEKLPSYKNNLVAKLQSLRPASGGTLQKLSATFTDLKKAATGEATDSSKGADTRDQESNELAEKRDRDAVASEPGSPQAPMPVKIVEDSSLPIVAARTIVTTVAAPLASLAMVFVLVVFMLLSREDLRNRFVRLAGNRLALTTRTLDEVGHKISRYLLMNGLVNGGFGLCVAIGLKIIGVEYALTWGLMAASLRFIPYIGPILATVLPVSMAFIQFPGTDWIHPGATLALFVVLELFCNNVVEPYAYGHGTGVSTVAILIAALFWGWIWGPVGLMLAVPITVMLAVLGSQVPALEPLAILLSDKPALAGWITYYQRLLAGDVDEAEQIVAEQRQSQPLAAVYDETLVRAISLAEKDYASGDLADEQRQFIIASTREVLEDADQAGSDSTLDEGPERGAQATVRIDPRHAGDPASDLKILGCSAHCESDELALVMLRQLLEGRYDSFEFTAAHALPSDVVARVAADKPDVVIVSSLSAAGGAETRYICKRLRRHFPSLIVIVGRWGYSKDRQEATDRIKLAGANHLAVSLAEARDLLLKAPVSVAPPTANAPVPHIAATA